MGPPTIQWLGRIDQAMIEVYGLVPGVRRSRTRPRQAAWLKIGNISKWSSNAMSTVTFKGQIRLSLALELTHCPAGTHTAYVERSQLTSRLLTVAKHAKRWLFQGP